MINYETGEISKWSSTQTCYTRIYIKVTPPYPICAHCEKKLKPDIWYIQINDKIYCSEGCVLAEYDWLEPYFMQKKEANQKQEVV